MKKIWIVALGTLLVSSQILAGFTSTEAFGDQATIPVAWYDFDQNGYLDLTVGNYAGSNQVYNQDENGTFTGTDQFGTKLNTFAVVWADVDNDGDADLTVGSGNSTKSNMLYLNDGDGTFTESEQFGSHRTIALAWSDFDLDGDLDLAVGNGILGNDEQNYLYVNDGNGTFTAREEFGQGQTGSLVWCDMDNDGDPDLAVGNGGFGSLQQNYLYINNSDGTFTEMAAFGLGDTASILAADADNDGDLDMAVGNWANSPSMLYINNGDLSFTAVSCFGDRDTNTLAWGDVDNDGDLDMAVGNGDFSSADQNYLYVNNNDGTFTEAIELGEGSTDSVAWADYDDDGDLDIAIGNEHSPSQNYLYTNTGPVGNFISITLKGQFEELGQGYSNTDGIGAKVSIYEAGHLGESKYMKAFREVSAHGGFSSQGMSNLHFGLKDDTQVDIRVTWPGSDGTHIIQDLPNQEANQKIIITEKCSLGVRMDVPKLISEGEDFYVTGFVDNPDEHLVDIPLFYALEILGNFWFWPDWTLYNPPESTDVSYDVMDFPTGTTQIPVIESFPWPDTGSDSLTGLHFFGAMTTSDMQGLLGEMASVEWGYN